MSGFRFRLERLARVRAIEEQLARERWAQSERAAREREERAESARGELDLGYDSLRRELAAGRLAPAPLLGHLALLDGLVARRAAALDRSRAARAVAETERASWLVERRKREGLERLERRERETWRAAESAREAAVLDEVASMRAARKARLESAENLRAARRAE